jgi:hypothetical protein
MESESSLPCLQVPSLVLSCARLIHSYLKAYNLNNVSSDGKSGRYDGVRI